MRNVPLIFYTEKITIWATQEDTCIIISLHHYVDWCGHYRPAHLLRPYEKHLQIRVSRKTETSENLKYTIPQMRYYFH